MSVEIENEYLASGAPVVKLEARGKAAFIERCGEVVGEY